MLERVRFPVVTTIVERSFFPDSKGITRGREATFRSQISRNRTESEKGTKKRQVDRYIEHFSSVPTYVPLSRQSGMNAERNSLMRVG